MGPILSTVLGTAALIAGFIAMWTGMARLGAPHPERPHRWARTHRISGWLFSVLFVVIFIAMVAKVQNLWEEAPPRIAIHVMLSTVALVLLLVKLTIARFFPGLKRYLFQLGVSLYLSVFCLMAISGGYFVLWRMAGRPYVSHGVYSIKVLDINIGKELLVTRCTACHTLKEIMTPRSAGEWEKVVNRMVDIGAPRITPDEGMQVLHYLVTRHAPKPRPADPKVDLIAVYCLPCHTRQEIFATRRTHAKWLETVHRMNELSPELVPADQLAEVVDQIVDEQESRNNNQNKNDNK